jgi:hypothetical protein
MMDIFGDQTLLATVSRYQGDGGAGSCLPGGIVVRRKTTKAGSHRIPGPGTWASIQAEIAREIQESFRPK